MAQFGCSLLPRPPIPASDERESCADVLRSPLSASRAYSIIFDSFLHQVRLCEGDLRHRRLRIQPIVSV
jgi:hypothetical protein